MEETRFMITPSELDVKNLFAYEGTKRLEKKVRK